VLEQERLAVDLEKLTPVVGRYGHDLSIAGRSREPLLEPRILRQTGETRTL
jgi:hypothetical protein